MNSWGILVGMLASTIICLTRPAASKKALLPTVCFALGTTFALASWTFSLALGVELFFSYYATRLVVSATAT
jgi:hypothetical protein